MSLRGTIKIVIASAEDCFALLVMIVQLYEVASALWASQRHFIRAPRNDILFSRVAMINSLLAALLAFFFFFFVFFFFFNLLDPFDSLDDLAGIDRLLGFILFS